MYEPLTRLSFERVYVMSKALGWGAIHDIDARSLQMRVFLLGLVITFALRYAPKGLIPERISHHH
jgi:branched-chain amino acid transport system permease protein